MNISGNYNTEQREVAIVRRIFDERGIAYSKIEKYANANDGDVCVYFSNGKTILIEVKEEKYDRFVKYGGDLGIDYISAFQFKRGVNPDDWKSQHRPEYLDEFLQAIDKTNHFKGGKVYYSKSDLWLFFVVAPNGNLYYCKFFDGNAMTSQEFINYIEHNCIFTVNIKPRCQESYADKHNSACFFLNHKDPVLQGYEIDLNDFVNNL